MGHRTSLIKDDNSSEAEWDIILPSLPFIILSRSVIIRAVYSRILGWGGRGRGECQYLVLD